MRTARSVEVSSVGVRLSSVLKPHSSLLTHQFSILNFSILTPQSSVLGPQFSVWKRCIFVAGRLNTFVLLHKHWVTAFLLQMSRKTQHTRFEDKILRKFEWGQATSCAALAVWNFFFVRHQYLTVYPIPSYPFFSDKWKPALLKRRVEVVTALIMDSSDIW